MLISWQFLSSKVNFLMTKLFIMWARIVEGSDDGGSSWFLLDKRSSQLFEKRFQRKTYQIEAAGAMSNAFR